MADAQVVHDFGHLGVTNDFLVAVQDPLAVLYNDKCVHCGLSDCCLLNRVGCSGTRTHVAVDFALPTRPTPAARCILWGRNSTVGKHRPQILAPAAPTHPLLNP
jgi:hypothetical protein